MAPKTENSTIKAEHDSTANVVPAKKRTTKAKKVRPLTSGKLPPLSSPKPSTSAKHRVIFIQNMPDGFFEKEVTSFFSQFGVVTKVYVARSKRTSRSKGFGYVQFQYPEVARIAASAVNNYLMFGKILKAKVVSTKLKTELSKDLAKAIGVDASEKFARKMKNLVRDKNGFVGEPRRQSLRLRQVDKLRTALIELKRAEIELPDMPQCFVEVSGLVKNNTDAKRIIKPVTVKKEEVEQNVDSSDDEDAFEPLKPSDWVVTEPDDEDTAPSQKLVKVEKSEGLKSKAKKTAEGKVRKLKKTEKKADFSKKAKKTSR